MASLFWLCGFVKILNQNITIKIEGRKRRLMLTATTATDSYVIHSGTFIDVSINNTKSLLSLILTGYVI